MTQIDGNRIAADGAAAMTGRQRFMVFAICLTVLIVDGVDIQLMAVLAPFVLKEWAVGTSQLGIALSAALVGMAVGAVAAGWLGDRWGNKKVLLGCTAVFGLATAAAGLANDVWSLAFLRFLSGLGFGGATPNALTIVSATVTPQRRVQALTLMAAGSPAGGVLISLAGVQAIPMLDWRIWFFILGALTLAVGILAAVLIPATDGIFVPPGKPDPVRETATPLEPRITIFSRGWLGFTVATSLCFGLSSIVTYGLANWMVIVLQSYGLAYEVAALTLSFYAFAALVGTFVAGTLIGMMGSRNLLIALTLLGLAALFAFPGHEMLASALGMSGRMVFDLASSAAGFVVGTISSILYAMVAIRYDVRIRATGSGLGLSIAKVGGFVAILVGGGLLEYADGTALFVFFGSALLAMMAVALTIRRHI